MVPGRPAVLPSSPERVQTPMLPPSAPTAASASLMSPPTLQRTTQPQPQSQPQLNVSQFTSPLPSASSTHTVSATAPATTNMTMSMIMSMPAPMTMPRTVANERRVWAHPVSRSHHASAMVTPTRISRSRSADDADLSTGIPSASTSERPAHSERANNDYGAYTITPDGDIQRRTPPPRSRIYSSSNTSWIASDNFDDRIQITERMDPNDRPHAAAAAAPHHARRRNNRASSNSASDSDGDGDGDNSTSSHSHNDRDSENGSISDNNSASSRNGDAPSDAEDEPEDSDSRSAHDTNVSSIPIGADGQPHDDLLADDAANNLANGLHGTQTSNLNHNRGDPSTALLQQPQVQPDQMDLLVDATTQAGCLHQPLNVDEGRSSNFHRTQRRQRQGLHATDDATNQQTNASHGLNAINNGNINDNDNGDGDDHNHNDNGTLSTDEDIHSQENTLDYDATISPASSFQQSDDGSSTDRSAAHATYLRDTPDRNHLRRAHRRQRHSRHGPHEKGTLLESDGDHPDQYEQLNDMDSAQKHGASSAFGSSYGLATTRGSEGDYTRQRSASSDLYGFKMDHARSRPFEAKAQAASSNATVAESVRTMRTVRSTQSLPDLKSFRKNNRTKMDGDDSSNSNGEKNGDMPDDTDGTAPTIPKSVRIIDKSDPLYKLHKQRRKRVVRGIVSGAVAGVVLGPIGIVVGATAGGMVASSYAKQREKKDIRKMEKQVLQGVALRDECMVRQGYFV